MSPVNRFNLDSRVNLQRWSHKLIPRVGARLENYNNDLRRLRTKYPSEVTAIEEAIQADERALSGIEAPSYDSAVRILRSLIRSKPETYLETPRGSLLAATPYIVFWTQMTQIRPTASIARTTQLAIHDLPTGIAPYNCFAVCYSGFCFVLFFYLSFFLFLSLSLISGAGSAATIHHHR